MKREIFISVVAILLLGGGAFLFVTSEQLGLALPSWKELEHLAVVANGELGEKSQVKWKDFLARSWKFAEENPNVIEIWLLRGAGALAAGDQEAGKDAGLHLVRFSKTEDATAQKLVMALWAKHYLSTEDLDWRLTIEFLNEIFNQKASTTYSVSSFRGFIRLTHTTDNHWVQFYPLKLEVLNKSDVLISTEKGNVMRDDAESTDTLERYFSGEGTGRLVVELLDHTKYLLTKGLAED